ncbi:hypothetical protein PLESTB_000876500 [Pleodorina starrii]|uniref:Uncharacterized protein n=1 Tax=Pleodorina starrii TaxID=330485 RepID=A0A9W6BND6_9CHLO|nr:hypothetical protein PLESTB_000876500 [Pleodorina starrii]
MCATPRLRDAERITCIMVTGKDASRVPLALQAISNFLDQSYPAKRLLIINHGPTKLKDTFLAASCTGCMRDCTSLLDELMVTKGAHGMFATLGELRNFALGKLQPRLVWRSRIPRGSVHVLARQDPRVRYLGDKDTMEDVRLLADYAALGLKVVTIENVNDVPPLYVRLVHG